MSKTHWLLLAFFVMTMLHEIGVTIRLSAIRRRLAKLEAATGTGLSKDDDFE